MYNFTKENEKRKKYACVYVYCESIVKRAEAGKEVFTSNFKPRATAFDSGKSTVFPSQGEDSNAHILDF